MPRTPFVPVDPSKGRICCDCLVWKRFSRYSPDKRRTPPRAVICKPCMVKRVLAWKAKNREHLREWNRAYYQRRKELK